MIRRCPTVAMIHRTEALGRRIGVNSVPQGCAVRLVALNDGSGLKLR
ncbi:MAG: hypothetical protein ACYSUC_04260 [Planctomycetota bacterium]